MRSSPIPWRTEGAAKARVALGQVASGRYLRVVYVPDPGRASAFVITAYDLGPSARNALRRHLRRKGK